MEKKFSTLITEYIFLNKQHPVTCANLSAPWVQKKAPAFQRVRYPSRLGSLIDFSAFCIYEHELVLPTYSRKGCTFDTLGKDYLPSIPMLPNFVATLGLPCKGETVVFANLDLLTVIEVERECVDCLCHWLCALVFLI